MEEYVVEFVKERIKENEEFFSQKELQIIYTNDNIIKKIYLLAIKNTREIA